MSEKLYWHFLPEDRRLRFGTREVVEVEKTIKVDCEPILCKQGLHASSRAIDALRYAPGPIVCLVSLGGKIVVDTDKVVAQERTVLVWADATRVLHEFACHGAEEALKNANVSDARYAVAIQAKRRWLAGEITEAELSAAWRVARIAAEGAAWNATWDATESAAVWDAVRSVARSAQNTLLEQMLNGVLPRTTPNEAAMGEK